MMANCVNLLCFSLPRTICCSVSRLKFSGNLATAVRPYCTDNKYEGNDDLSPETIGFLKAQDRLDEKLAADHQLQAKEQQASDRLKNVKKDPGLSSDSNKSFTELLRESPMTKLGDFSNQKVVGKIVARVEDELYIDYGGKFDCVCKVPKQDRLSTKPSSADGYKVGAEVVVKVRDHEMTARFMGYDKDMTLLEADAKLISLSFNELSESDSKKPQP